MRRLSALLTSVTLALGIACARPGTALAQAATTAANTFTNPLLPSGADPWVIAHNGTYYYMNSMGKNLTLWATKDITDLQHARKKVVWTPPATGPYSHDLWAPELHRFDNRWYLYFAADAGDNESHRIYVLENTAEDPLSGTWTLKGKVGDPSDKWAIDASAFEVNGQKYLIWSGWKGNNDGEQDIYIAHLKNPWTIDSERTLISYPQYPWEHVGDLPGRPAMPHVEVNEGPEILLHGDNIFLVYSGSACWTDYYELGVLRAKLGADLLSAASWQKYDHPFFTQNRDGHAFGPGHNSFFKSPDGTQDWIIYHANPGTQQGCGDFRSPRAQAFTWNADGTPNFGTPIPTGTPIAKPSQ